MEDGTNSRPEGIAKHREPAVGFRLTGNPKEEAVILEKILRFAGKVVDAVEDSAYLNTEKNVEEVATDLFGEETETKLFAENLSK